MGATRAAEALCQAGECVTVELGVEQERRLERVEPLVGQRRQARPEGAGREMLAVEGGVVGDEDRVADEVGQSGQCRARTRRVAHVVVSRGPRAA